MICCKIAPCTKTGCFNIAITQKGVIKCFTRASDEKYSYEIIFGSKQITTDKAMIIYDKKGYDTEDCVDLFQHTIVEEICNILELKLRT